MQYSYSGLFKEFENPSVEKMTKVTKISNSPN